MTILHILKYQLSDPPTEEECYNLPKPVLEKLKRTPFQLYNILFTQKKIGWEVYEENLKYLKELLNEYEDDNIPHIEIPTE